MIEETLNNEKGHPAETALAMLSFLQSELPAGGPAAESRFFHSLYGPLCDRIFGAILGDRPEDGYRHQDGGWLSLQVRWSRPPSLAMTLVSSSSSPRHRTGNIPGLVRSVVATDTTDPVLQLLGTPDKPQRPHAAHNVAGKDDGVVVVVVVEPVFAAPPTLLESIANATDRHPSVGFAFEFYALPKHTQEAWIYLVESVLGGSTAPTTATASTTTPTTTNSIDDICTYNDVRLLGYLLQNRPEEQTQLRLLKQQQQQRSVLTSHENFRHFASHPHHAAGGSPRGFHSFSPPSSSSATPVATPLLLGSVKLSSPGQIPGRASETATTASPKVMLTMLEHYLVLFLRYPTKPPDRQAVSMSTIPGVHVHRIAAPSLTTATAAGSRNSSSSSNTMREAFGDRVYCHVFDRYMKYFLPHEPDEGRYIAFATDETNRDSELFLRLLISLWIDSLAPVVRTQRVLQLFLDRNRRIGMDDASLLSTLDLSASYDLTQRVEPYRATLAPIQKCLRRLIDHALLDPKISAPATTTSLSPCMIALAYPFYNYVRTSFRFASIHSLDSAFYGALDSWLVWLEPWNVVVHSRNATQLIMGSVTRVEQPKLTSLRTINTPRYNQPSKYTSAWEPYVALNLHMYAVPLAIFLRRARELDFSADKFERSIEIVMRVFRVFSSEVVDAISRHLESRQSSPVPPLVLTHQETLGPFAPPVGVLALTSLKADMQSLLEEIDAQHSKRVRELDTFGWFVGKFEGFFGQGVVSGEEKKLEGLMDRAKIIARLPVEYNLLPRKGPSATAKHANDQDTNSIQDSTKNGELTDSGRALLLTGAIKSNLADVRYRGDRMRARVGLYEFKFLVDFSVWASDALNERLGLGDKTFRINLRFVADRRNFFPIILTFYFTMIALRNFW